LIPFISFAQKDLENGYIIKNDDEQINGFIKIRSNIQNSKSCLFSKNVDGITESFDPSDIKAYKTDTKYYVSHEIDIDLLKQKVFLEYLIDGIADLYYLKDISNEYYFIKKDGLFTRLEK
jgi:hypothetical protein